MSTNNFSDLSPPKNVIKLTMCPRKVAANEQGFVQVGN
jgi:hypothetical protein